MVYEVLWTRRLSLTFGHTVLAVSTVLTVFMTGLALGSFLAGRWSDRKRQELVKSQDQRGGSYFLSIYGKLEIFIGVWAVLSLLLLNGVESLYLNAARNGAGGSTLYFLVFAGSFLVLLPPTTAMGATLPAFTQLLVATREDVGQWLSRIYGWNTLGACCGAAMGGFFLLPQLGLKFSVVGAALGNLALGTAAIVGSSKLESAIEESAPESGEAETGTSGGWLLPVAFGLSGFAAMVYQLGWTRGLILSIGSSTYSFAIILTAFLASLGLGSLIYKMGMGERTPQVWHLAVLQFMIALSSLLATHLIGRLPALMVKAIPALNHEFFKILLFDFGLAFGLMFLPTLAMGLTFPLVTHLYTDELSSLGKRLGEAYAANTCGAILGSFLAGFVLVPQLGAQQAILGAVVLNLVVGLILVLSDKAASSPKTLGVALSLVGVVAVVLCPRWDPSELSAGAGIYANSDNFLFRPAYYKDGVSATVTVGFNGPHSPYLKVNGKTDASLGIQDMAHQILTGLLPAALHPGPKRVALVGLGSGVTAATLVALDSVEVVRCAELEPAIVEVQSYFNPYTNNVVEDPKLDLEVNDGRTFILGAPGKFDLIVSQPSNPWIAGIGNLYTEDFYQACLERLEEDGLMCQWFQLYSVSSYDLELVLTTFFKVFPEGMVFQIGPGDVFLVGAAKPVKFDPQRLDALWNEPDVAYWLQLIGLLEPEYIFGTYVASRTQVMESMNSQIQALNTDDRPLLEFQAPRSLYLKDSTVAAFPQSFPDVVPAEFQDDGEAVMGGILGRIQLGRYAGLQERIQDALGKGFETAPLAAAVLSQRGGDLAAAEGLLRALPLEKASQPSVQLLLGDLRKKAQQWDVAVAHYENALQNPPPGASYLALVHMGESLAQSGDLAGAVAAFEEAATLSSRPDPLNFAGAASLTLGEDKAARAFFEAALKRDPNDYLSLSYLAFIQAREGEIEQAYANAMKSYQLFPELSSNVEILANLAAERGERSLVLRLRQELADLRQREAALLQQSKSPPNPGH